ncbi:MAG: hypothetical protein IKM59_02785 [Oscillospiraceae bacterium]|nr:hypothetical protein [Oscillospiraceae bacterium]
MVVEAKTIRKQTSNQIIVLEDGYYIEIELNDRSGLARANVSGSKTYTYYNDADEALWKATVTGSFTYDGRYASCTSSSCNVTVYDSTWYTISKTAWTDENFAKASVEMGRKVLGVTVNRTTYNLSLLCDRYGNLS